MSKQQKITIKSFKGRDGLLLIKDDWIQLTNAIKKRFLHLYQWYESYVNSIGKHEKEIIFIVLYQEESPILIFPLNISCRKILGFTFDTLEIPDHPHIDLSDIISKNNIDFSEAIKLIQQHLREVIYIKYDYIFLPHLLADASCYHFLYNLSSHLTAWENAGKCDYITVNSYPAVYERYSKNFKRRLKKARKKLLELPNVLFISAKGGSDLDKSYEEFLTVEASGWKGEQGNCTAIKLHPELREFYRTLAYNYAKFNGCEINLLKIGNHCIAGQFCLKVEETIYVLKIGYDEAYSHIGPGNILLENLIERAAEDKTLRYVNLITGSEWHALWKPKHFKVIRAYIFRKSFLGLVAFFLVKTRKLIRAIFYR